MIVTDGVLVSVSQEDIINNHFDIPENIHTIGENAFSNAKNLKSVTIPNSVKKIEPYAFAECDLLSSIEIPSSVVEISNNVFENCSNLQNIKLPENLKSIGNNAFFKCLSLKSITIPNSVETIGSYAFDSCEKLESIRLPKNLKKIEKFTFNYCYNLKNIVLPKNIEFIGQGAFMECSKLKSILIPQSVKTIEACTFYNCVSLSKVGLSMGLEKIFDNAFLNCHDLSSIKLPKTLTYIGKHAFTESGLKSVEIPENVAMIDYHAFEDCRNLTNLKLNEGVKTIGDSAFRSCSIKKLILPKSIMYIKNNAFADNTKLESVNIQSQISTISQSLFSNCYSLKNVTLSDTIKSINDYAFSDCKSLEKINLCEGLLQIFSNAFSNCHSLEEINIPSTVKLIDSFAFENCKKLKSITIPNGVQNIYRNTFNNCENLESITLNNGLKSIGDNAFSHCAKLRTIIIPDTVEIIGNDAFRNCFSLSQLFIPKSIKQMGIYTGIKLPYYTKKENGFLFSRPDVIVSSARKHIQNETYYPQNNQPQKPLYLNLSVLCSNWDKIDLLLSEQRNPNVANFYNEIYAHIPKEQADKILDSHNFTFFKQIAGKYNLREFYTYKFLYDLGLFSKPIEFNGKKIDYAQKVGGVLLEKLESKVIDNNKLFFIGVNMPMDGFKKEFTDFFLENFDEFIAEESRMSGFIAKSYAKFEEIQKTNTSNRGSQRQLKPTIKKFKDYLKENKYEGITPETRPIANAISPFFGAQSYFDNAVKIMKEKQQMKTPDHILNIPLKEERHGLGDEFKGIDDLSEKIKTTQIDTIHNLARTAENEFTYEWLSKNDPQNLILGKLCSCCAHIGGMGHGIMHASIIDPNVQNLVIRDRNNEIIAKATLYVNRKEGYGVINTFQLNLGTQKEYYSQIYDKYMLGIRDFIEEYNKENPDNPLKKVNVGMGLNDLEGIIIKKLKKETDLLTPINYGFFGANGNYYEGDAFKNQYILWEADDLATKQNDEIIPEK